MVRFSLNRGVSALQLYVLIFLQLINVSYQQENNVCSDIRAMIRQGPKSRGKVEKRGVLPPHEWWELHSNENFKELNQKVESEKLVFSEDMQLLKNNVTVTEKMNDFPKSARCQVFIDPDHKLAYMKNAKTGGSSLSVMLEHACRLELPADEKFGKVYQCLRAPQFVEISSVEEAEEIWKNYFVFTTVRNPYSRAASAYQYLLKRRISLNTHSKKGCRSPSFQQFSLNPFIIGLQSQQYGCSENKIHDYLHVEKESQCLFDSKGEFVVDYILSMDNFEEDWVGMVKEIELRQGSDQEGGPNNKYIEALKETKPLHKNPVSNGSDYASDLFINCGQQCVTDVANYYKEDFELLGYDKCLTS